MKKLLTLNFLLLSLQLAFSQMTFAPIGAIWTFSEYSMGSSGYHKFESLADTTIQNKTFRKISEIYKYSFSWNLSSQVVINKMHYYTQSNDTILEWQDNKLNYRFNFNIKVNDTIRFPINWQSKIPTVVITSIKDTLVNNSKVKYYTWKSLTCDTSKSNVRYDHVNIRSLDFINTIGPFWIFLNFSVDCVGNYEGPFYSFCSYSDNSFQLGTSCEPTPTQEINNQITLKINPNPSSDFIKIESNHIFKTIQIMDISGKILQKHIYTEGDNINISSLSKGLYFIQLIDNQGNYAFKKFIKI